MVAMKDEFQYADVPTLEERRAESLRAERVGDYTQALALQERINATSGLNYDSCMRVAWLHYRAGGYRRAREYYEIAGLFSEKAEAPLMGALDCCVAMGDTEGANEYIDALLRIV